MSEYRPGEHTTAEESDTEGQLKRRDMTDEGSATGAEDLKRRDIVGDDESDTEGQLKRRDVMDEGSSTSGAPDLKRRDIVGDDESDTEGQLKRRD